MHSTHCITEAAQQTAQSMVTVKRCRHMPMQIYRSFKIGKLIKLIMLDTRIIGRNLQNFTDRLVSRGGGEILSINACSQHTQQVHNVNCAQLTYLSI